MGGKMKTVYLLDFRERYFDDLLKFECYELLEFLTDRLDENQIMNRFKWRIKQKEERELEFKRWNRWLKEREALRELVSSISFN